jgi:uncharacterized Rmd1/YagE family protein
MTAGSDISNGAASSLTDNSGSAASRITSARRVGSASAAKVRSSGELETLTIRLSIGPRPRLSTDPHALSFSRQIQFKGGIRRPFKRLCHNQHEFVMTDLPTARDGRITFRAMLLGDRIETAGLERSDVLSTLPLAFRAGQRGIVALFRYGVAVMVGMSPLEEDEVIRRLDGRVVAPIEPREEETVQIEIAPERDDQIAPSGAIVVKALTTEHTLLIADALATSVVLAHDEKNVATVFGVIQPIAQQLAQYGRTPGGRRAILKHIGNALLVQHRVSGLVAVAEKPDVLWERPDLERLYARLEDEYELKERADVLTRKLTVISDSAKAFADIIDTERSLRLELIIVVLIAVEIVIAGFQLWVR